MKTTLIFNGGDYLYYFFKMSRQVVISSKPASKNQQRCQVAIAAETGDNTHNMLSTMGFLPYELPRKKVRQVHLNHRDIERANPVGQRLRGVGPSARIDDNSIPAGIKRFQKNAFMI